MAYITVNPVVYRINSYDKLYVLYETDEEILSVQLTIDNKATYIPCESFTQTQAVFDLTGRNPNIYEQCYLKVETVTSVETITLSPKTLNLNSLNTSTITPTILPADANNKNVIWSSSNERVATVSNGVVTPLRTGNTTIMCKSEVRPNVYDTCAVVVDLTGVNIPCQSISLDKSTISITDSMSVNLKAILNPDNTTDIVNWTVSPTNIATLTKQGDEGCIITPVKNGNCTVTATCNGKSASCSVAVSGLVLKPCTGLDINPITASGKVGETITISASVTPSDTTDPLVWTTSDPNVAIVNKGTVTFVSEGSCTITATCGSYSETCSIAVIPEFEVPSNAIYSYTGEVCSYYIVNEPYDTAQPTQYYYPFQNNNSWITSTSQNHDSTYCMCRIHVETYEDTGFVITATVSSEQHYDYAIFSYADVPLSQDSERDDRFQYCTENNGSITNRVVYNLTQGQHDIWVKYIKDSSNSDGDDTLKFKVAGTQPYSVIPETALMSEISGNYYWYAENLDISVSNVYDWDIYNDGYGVQYLRSTNYNVNSSSAICRIVFNSERPIDVKFKISMDSESNFDILYFGKPNQVYNAHSGADASLDRDKYSGAIGLQYVYYYDLPAGENVIYLKYFKDTSTHADGDRCYVLIDTITVK